MKSTRRPMSRRRFLEWLGAAGGGLAIAGCAPAHPVARPETPTASASTTAAPRPLPTQTQSSLPTGTAAPPKTATPVAKAVVGIARAPSYDPALLRGKLETLLDGLGGLAGLIRPGAKVGIKANLTGGPWWDGQLEFPAVETFVTHPEVVAALAGLCRDAGASKIYVLEGIAEQTSWKLWGYTAVAASLDLRLIDLCQPAPYNDFTVFPVGANRLVYDAFYLNPLLKDLDLLISVAKMKTHATTGVTLSMKNLVGLTPIDRYKRSEKDTNRTALHHTVFGFDDRMPRVVVDLNLACPVHLAVIDGIRTCEGAAGPWDMKTLRPVQPGLLLAGLDPVATDSVATAVMGYDPEAPVHAKPFLGGENHLALAREAGIGTNRLAEVRIFGETIESARFPFKLVGE